MSWLTGVERLILLCLWGIVRLLKNPVEEVKQHDTKC